MMLFKPIIVLKIFAKPSGLIVAAPVAITIFSMGDEAKALLLLLLVYTIDFITGVLGSFIQNFKEHKKTTRFDKIRVQKRYIRFLYSLEFFVSNTSSEKLKKSIIKVIGYCVFIFCFYGLERTFKLKSFVFDSISHMEWTITLLAIGGCIAVEIYSIIFENLKKMGFDVIKLISNLSGTYKDVKNSLDKE